MPNQPPAKTRKLPVILVIVGIAIIGLFGYSIWAEKNANNNTADEDIGDTTISQSLNRGISSTPPQQLSEAERALGRQRDAERISDIKQIRDALERYKTDKDAYPESLSSLIPDYLQAIPENPAPNGIEYSYTPIGGTPYTYYDLNYSLEVGADDISYGDHTASPDGIAFP
ncbi:MAG: hypothetical protein WC544_02955 [Patescibacteria group bacterium]